MYVYTLYIYICYCHIYVCLHIGNVEREEEGKKAGRKKKKGRKCGKLLLKIDLR